MPKDYSDLEAPPSALREAFRRRRQEAARRRGDELGGGSAGRGIPSFSSALPPRTPAVKTGHAGRACHATARKPAPSSRAVTPAQRKAPHTAPPAISFSSDESSDGDFVEMTSRLVAERNRARQRKQFNWRDADWGASDSDDDFSVRQVIIQSLAKERRTQPSNGRHLRSLNSNSNTGRERGAHRKEDPKATFSECLENTRQTHKGGQKKKSKGRREKPVYKSNTKETANESNGDDSSRGDTATFGGDVDYENVPEVPQQLDAHEFKVYTNLVEVKFKLRKEEERERHNNIIQCKTLCELIRRRRNDAGFASRKSHRGNTKAVKADLLSVWGIGPSKAAKDGVAWELLEALDAKENTRRLKLSRRGVRISDEDSSGGLVHQRRSRAEPKTEASSHPQHSSPSVSPKVPRYVVFRQRK
ncbi:hypothetical protein ACHAXT_012980 [Thalassiosira profunda]